MPNLLAHYGAQGIASRMLFRRLGAQWLLLGCMVPDAPWIVQRAVRATEWVDPYELRLYTTVQASLAGCLLLCGALALVSAAPRVVFLLLASNSVLHLLLDATQTKWANGVHLFAPFSWKYVNFDLYWPGSPVSHVLTLSGLVVVLRLWRLREPWSALLARPSPARTLGALALLVAYLAVPLGARGGPLAANNDYVRTLLEVDSRPGRQVEFDRAPYREGDGVAFLTTFAGEELEVLGRRPGRSGTVSARATFEDARSIRIRESHVHLPWWRDAASYVGLGLLLLFWLVPARSVPVRRPE